MHSIAEYRVLRMSWGCKFFAMPDEFLACIEMELFNGIPQRYVVMASWSLQLFAFHSKHPGPVPDFGILQASEALSHHVSLQ